MRCERYHRLDPRRESDVAAATLELETAMMLVLIPSRHK